MRRLLIVAYQFPPLGGIGSTRISAFAHHLREYGWEATVLAPRNGAYYRDPTLAFPEERVVRAHSFEISRVSKRILRAGGDAVTPAAPGAVGLRLQRLARGLVYYPDPKVGWYLPAVIAGHRAVRHGDFDAIYSSASPQTTHPVARRLHQATGLPWIAEYRDPWVDLTYQGDAVQRARRLEDAIAREASGIVMTSPNWARTYSERWQRPVTVITNGCDDRLPPRIDGRGRRVIAHLGTMYPHRNRLGVLWGAIAEHGGVDAVRFIGRVHPDAVAELNAAGLGQLVEETGFLPRAAAMEVMSRSSMLLLAGPDDAGGVMRGWIPAKVFDYLATDLPILYIGDTRADVAAMLRDYDGCHVLEPSDSEGVAAALRECQDGRRYVRDVTPVTRRALTATLAMLLDQVTAGSHEGG
jgi:hypothetical protein